MIAAAIGPLVAIAGIALLLRGLHAVEAWSQTEFQGDDQ